MILIHKIKKIKQYLKLNIFRELLLDLFIYIFFFAFGVFFVVFKLNDNNRGENILILESDLVEQKIETNDTKIINSKEVKFVASSRGKYFYPVGSSRANSLSEKNKLYFNSEEEAKKLGFKPYLTN